MLKIIQHSGQHGSPLEPITEISTPFSQWAPSYQHNPMVCISHCTEFAKFGSVYQALIPVSDKKEYYSLLDAINTRIFPKTIQSVCLYQYAGPNTPPFLGICNASDTPTFGSHFTTFVLAVNTDPHWSIDTKHLKSIHSLYSHLASNTYGFSVSVDISTSQHEHFHRLWSQSLDPLHVLAAHLKQQNCPL